MGRNLERCRAPDGLLGAGRFYVALFQNIGAVAAAAHCVKVVGEW